MTAPRQARLGGIEAIRGAASVSVILYHCARHVAQAEPAPLLISITRCGHAGVDLFFVLSGFIIAWVHARDWGQPQALGRYARRRVVRVLPLYWVALGLTVAIASAGGHACPPLRLLASALLLPSDTPPLLGVAWTLQFEVVFYALFAVLIASRRWGLILLAAWAAWIAAEWSGAAGPTFLPRSLSSAYNLEFLFGMAAAAIIGRRKLPRPRLVATIGAALLAGMAVAEDCHAVDGYGPAARLGYGLASALLIAASAEADRAGRLLVPPVLRHLGRASYSLYLFQFVFIGIAWKGLTLTGAAGRAPAIVAFALLVGAAVAGGVLVSRLVEHPLLALLRRRGAGRSAYRTEQAGGRL